MAQKRFIVGIDAGKQTGFAIYDREKKQIIYHGTSDFWTVYNLVINFQKTNETRIVIETPNSKRAFYDRLETVQIQRQRERISKNIGGNRREAELLADGLEKLGFEVLRVAPSARKWTADDLCRYTKMRVRTSQHVRDAIQLVWGL
jgi:hypothetical protein